MSTDETKQGSYLEEDRVSYSSLPYEAEYQDIEEEYQDDDDDDDDDYDDDYDALDDDDDLDDNDW